jgi:plastocyanin
VIKHRVRTLTVIAVLAAVALAGCGKSNKVGDKSLLNFQDQANARLGERTSTTVGGPATTAPAGKAAVGGSTPTTQSAAQQQAAQQAQQQAQQQRQQAATIEIAINGDGAQTQFDPSAIRVPRGAYLKFINKDSVARSVLSDDGSTFQSPSIAPGGTWTWQANTTGSFPFHDGTRPYAVGTVEVR